MRGSANRIKHAAGKMKNSGSSNWSVKSRPRRQSDEETQGPHVKSSGHVPLAPLLTLGTIVRISGATGQWSIYELTCISLGVWERKLEGKENESS